MEKGTGKEEADRKWGKGQEVGRMTGGGKGDRRWGRGQEKGKGTGGGDGAGARR